MDLIAYLVLGDEWFVASLGLGGLERWVAYPIIFWLLGAGAHFMATGIRDRRV